MSEQSPRDRLIREMELRLLAEVGRRRRRQRKRKWLALGASGMVLVVGAASAWVWLVAPLFAERGAHCFVSADTSSSYIEAGAADKSGAQDIDVADPVAAAEDICRSLWQAGVLGEPIDDKPLFVCRGASGVLQVFPVDEEKSRCDEVGSYEPR